MTSIVIQPCPQVRQAAAFADAHTAIGPSTGEQTRPVRTDGEIVYWSPTATLKEFSQVILPLEGPRCIEETLLHRSNKGSEMVGN